MLSEPLARDPGHAASAVDLEALIAHLPTAVYVCEAPSGVIRLYNRRAVELWGREPALGDTDQRFCGSLRLYRTDGTPLPHAETPMAAVLRDGTVRDDEVVIERPDGSRVTVRVNIAPIRDGEGRIRGAVNAFQDITERKQAEETAARLAAVVAGADDAIISKTLDGIITSWNQAAERSFGHAEADVIGRSMTVIIPPDRLHEEAQILERLRRGERIEQFETERVTRDGRRIPVALTVSPVKGPDGRILGISTIARDITERRRVEQTLTDQVERLEMLYRLADLIARPQGIDDVCATALDALTAVGGTRRASVLVFDDTATMRFRAWRGLSDGYRAAVEGHSPWTPDAAHPAPILVEDAATDPRVAPLRGVIAAEGIRALAFVPLVHRGRVLGKFMLYHDAPHRFSAEEVRLATTIAQHVAIGLARVQGEDLMKDLLLREQAARKEADTARAEAERANRGKDEFLAMLAHELRNPLGAIVSALGVIEDGGHAHPERAARARAVIRRQTGHLGRLLDDLLDVARITRGRIELALDHVDLRAAVEEAVEGQRHRVDGKRQRIVVSTGDEPALVVGDAVRLQQVLGNLLNNATKYTPAGGSIRVTVAAEGEHVVLTVQDDGIGIPVDKLESVFELFAQASPSLARTEGGLGIGLTLVRRVVELHGGDVQARSEGEGRGATFVVRLPRAARALPSAPRAAVTPGGPSRRILVIEDNDDGREMLATTLQLAGHQVHEAATGRQGLEMAACHAPDVVLVDIGLPDVSGYEVAQRLRATLGRGVRLVAFTGYGQPQDRERSAAVGFDAHVVKPIDPVRLADVLRRLG